MQGKKFELALKDDMSWDFGGLAIQPCNALTAYLYAFREHADPKAKEDAFWEIANILWVDGQPQPLLEPHKWAKQTVRECIREKYLALGGSAGSGKSYTMAAFAIVEWLCDPANTLVLVTSTTLTAARGRIWGCIMKLLDAVPGLPIKIRDSIGSAAYLSPDGSLAETAGIRLIAAEKSQSRDAVGKLIGLHAPRVVLIADELSELSEAILQAGLANLNQTPYFRLRAASNPSSRFDPFGIWSEPKDGWDSVDPINDKRWRTKYGGLFIRFDAEDSPNLEYDDADPPYPYLPTRKGIDEAKDALGEKSRNFMRMFRAVFAESDEAEGIYNEMELMRSGAMNKVELRDARKVAACDPSFTSGGDDTVIAFGEVGYDPSGQFVLQLDEMIKLHDDATDKSTPRTFQIARLIKEACVKRGVDAYDFAIDATAAGNPMADVLASEWSPEFLRVQFGGSASDKPVSASKRTPASHLFVNRVSELWFAGKELIRCRQLRGITNDIAKEMCGRTYDTTKGQHGLRMRAESKLDYKRRHGSSPDSADAFFVLVELARDRHGLLAVEPIKGDDETAPLRRNLTFKKLDVLKHTNYAHLLD